MKTEIPAELQEQLNIIKKETAFFSQPLQKTSTYLFVIGGLLFATLALFSLRTQDHFLVLFCVVLVASEVASYFHQRSLFKMYSGACEIINYYKKSRGR